MVDSQFVLVGGGAVSVFVQTTRKQVAGVQEDQRPWVSVAQGVRKGSVPYFSHMHSTCVYSDYGPAQNAWGVP